ncbi:MAG TPA: hypothetical protein VG839_09290, partial [Asticcacaulis sp.]|nr:hypothetical protein [Asticcacaulis sp.]
MKKHFFTVLTAAAFFLGSGSTAHAITLGLKFQVSTGLDESTQNFIATLPKLFHDEFIATLTDALPIIERGEDYTFNKLDESIDKLSDDAQCAELTLPLVIRASSKIGSHGETYITDVEEFTKTELGKINDHTRPDTALNLYANILDTIQSTRCHTRRSGITVNAALNQQYAIADTGARPWLYLIGLDCDKPAKCYT